MSAREFFGTLVRLMTSSRRSSSISTEKEPCSMVRKDRRARGSFRWHILRRSYAGDNLRLRDSICPELRTKRLRDPDVATMEEQTTTTQSKDSSAETDGKR